MKSFLKKAINVIIGTPIFWLLRVFFVIPSGIPGINVNMAYAFLSSFSAVSGPIAGGIIGLAGSILADFANGRTYYWPWIIANGLFGILMGLAGKRVFPNGITGEKHLNLFQLYQVIVNLLMWLVVASGLDYFINKEPIDEVLVSGCAASICNIITCIVFGGMLLSLFIRTKTKRATKKTINSTGEKQSPSNA